MEKIEKQAAEARENVAEETQSGTEPVSGETGAGTKEQPYDAGNAPEQPSSDAPSTTTNGATTSTTDSSPQPPLAVNTNLEATKKETDPAKTPGTPDWARAPKRTATEKVAPNEPKPSTTTNGNTTNGAQQDRGRGVDADGKPRPPPLERDVSPGTRADGSHATTSGDKGQSYTPPTGLGKLKGKIFGGK